MVEALTFDACTGTRGRRGRLRAGHRRGRLPGCAKDCPSGTPIASPAGSWACWRRRAGRWPRPPWRNCSSLSPLFGEDYYAVVDLDRVVAGKVSPGGTAPERVEEQLGQARGVLAYLQGRRGLETWSGAGRIAAAAAANMAA